MIRKIDDIYLSIALIMKENLVEPWDKAVIRAEVHNGVVRLKGGSESSGEYTSFKLRNFNRQIISDFEELHEVTTEGKEGRWNRALLSLRPDGTFSVDFVWDQELADEVAGEA